MPLPPEIRAMAEFAPVEDVALAILRDRFSSIDTIASEDLATSWIKSAAKAPFVLVRRSPESLMWRGDHRFINGTYLDVNVFTDGLDADADASILSEAVRVTFRDAWRNQKSFGLNGSFGHLSFYDMTISPHRRPDWATATGPVQYADLPSGWIRYEATHYLEIRQPA